MRNLLNIITMSFLVVGTVNFANAQADSNEDSHQITIKVPEVALLDLETTGSGVIELTATAPTEAGLPLTFSATDNQYWINYSSIIGATKTERKVTVSLDNAAPSGLALTVLAATDAGLGKGTVGTPTAAVTLSTAEQDIITGVKSCYTNHPASHGHQLTYSLDFVGTTSADYGLIQYDEAGTTLTVTYTLSDN